MNGLTKQELEHLIAKGVVKPAPFHARVKEKQRMVIDAAYHRNWRRLRGAKPRRSWPQLKGLVGNAYRAAYMKLRREIDGVWTRNKSRA